MSPETKTQHWRRRGAELDKVRKAELCAMFRRLGYVGGLHPPEKWRKDEVINSIVDIEWGRLPEDQKLPTPPLMCPPCDECGGGQDAPAHRYGGDHHYTYTDDPDVTWVRADHEPPAEEQPTEANATPADQDLIAACTPNSQPFFTHDGNTRCEHGYQINVMDLHLKILVTIDLPDWESFRPASAGHRLIEHGYMIRPEARGPETVNGWRTVGSGWVAPVFRTDDVLVFRTAAPAVLEGGTGPGVLADQTRERPDLIPPALHVNRCTPGEAGHTDCEGASE